MTDLDRTVRSLVRDVRNFPRKGIVFKDITPLLRDAAAFHRVCASMEEFALRRGADVVAAIESRGFLFGAAVAARMERGLVPVRKFGKLPGKTFRQSYKLEYGTERIEVHRDGVMKGERVVVVDDVLATGGTLAGACRLIEKMGGVVAGCAVVLELGFLGGRRALKGREVFSIVKYEEGS